MMQLNHTYNRDDFLKFLEDNFLTDFKKDIRPAGTQGFSSIQKAYSLGRSESLDLQVFEFSFKGSPNKRVTLTKDAFQVMRSSAIFRALAIFHSPDSDDWRLSLMTATPERTEKGKVSLSYSNPKRLSFFLGPNAKVNTPTRFILKNDKVADFEDLKSRFSIEVVNKEFYKEISEYFTQLVGGSLYKSKKKEVYKTLLKLPFVQDKSQTSLEFAVRLIGRVIFCWFLREKKSNKGKSLMPNDLLSLVAVKNNPDYYHKILEPIFFEILNKPIKSRKDDYSSEPFSSIPYLNGGLFSPHDDDYYKRTNSDFQSQFHNTLVIPDEWLIKFIEVLETYNFTIDENTSFDEELSIDPEMLGRIFENLLAEINPETGETARKSTGSYYTPRVIVDYMVDESLLLYLKNQTQIEERKLKSVISYDLNDDEETPLKNDEKEQIINALERVKILDPACGSGAFPMGALQKIVFILQQADPEGQLWFKKQIKNTSPEIKNVIEREFAHKNFDYIRKLGIIRENIYGVDIQPIATEISRLRCFLTLVVDQRIQEEFENRGIEPLPNLDFKFVTANTLIGLPGSGADNQMGLFEDDAGIKELKELRDMFFNASGAERDQLKLQFVQAQNRMFQRLISEGRRGHADLTTKLTTWDPFSHKSASWFDSEWMFGIKIGFDIIIGNPPYGAKLSKEFSKWAREFFETAVGEIDSYTLFVERSIKLLRDLGVLSFILPDTWLTLVQTEKFRRWILNRYYLNALVMLNGLVFQEGIVDTMLLFLIKTEIINEKRTKIRVAKKNQKIYNIDELPILNNQEQKNWLKEPKSQIKVYATSEINDLLKKIIDGSYRLDRLVNYRSGCKPYEEGKGRPPQSAKTILQKPYTSSLKKSHEWLPLLRGNDIQHYYIRKKKPEWILYGEWLAAPRSMEVFSGERLLVQAIRNPSLKDRIIASWTNKTFITRINVYSLLPKSEKVNLLFILGILNSTLMNWFLKKDYGLHTYVITGILAVPIKIVNEDNIQKVSCIVSDILTITESDYLKNSDRQAKVEKCEKQIDQIVYKLYKLTPEEIQIVESKND